LIPPAILGNNYTKEATMAQEINNKESILDSLHIITRLKELEDMLAQATHTGKELDCHLVLELKQLREVDAQARKLNSNWQAGEILVHDEYFSTYAEQEAEAIKATWGNVPDIWPNNCKNKTELVDNLKKDCASIRFGESIYWLAKD
jgi:hypothetical protein